MAFTDSSPPPAEDAAQRQARLRRERRDAKIKAGGSARLEKISNLSGRPPPSDIAPPSPAAKAQDDPEEIDISNHSFSFSRPYNSNDSSPQSQIPAELQQFLRSNPPPGANPFGPTPGEGEAQQDPMVAMLQQLMGSLNGTHGPGQSPANGSTGGGSGLPPGLAAMLGTGPPSTNGSTPESPQADTYAYLWRIIHALFALSFGLYITFTTAFTGTHLSRHAPAPAEHDTAASIISTPFFWIFSTGELLLQSSRYFLEGGGEAVPTGMMGTASQFLPMPWKGYLLLVLRYARIWSTIVEDAMVVLFILGGRAWWQGLAG